MTVHRVGSECSPLTKLRAMGGATDTEGACSRELGRGVGRTGLILTCAIAVGSGGEQAIRERPELE